MQPAPTLKVQHFVYPHFFVTFQSELQLALARADGRTAEFTAAIQTLCSGQPRWGRSFKAELAIDYGFEGQFDAVLAKFAAEESLRKQLFKR